jgi:hypothetical protein
MENSYGASYTNFLYGNISMEFFCSVLYAFLRLPQNKKFSKSHHIFMFKHTPLLTKRSAGSLNLRYFILMECITPCARGALHCSTPSACNNVVKKMFHPYIASYTLFSPILHTLFILLTCVNKDCHVKHIVSY